MSASNIPSKPPTTSKRRAVMIIAMFPVGAILGFLGGLLIEIIVGLIARAVFSAEHPGSFLHAVPRLTARPRLLDRRDPGAHPVRPRCVVGVDPPCRTSVRIERQSRLQSQTPRVSKWRERPISSVARER